MRITVLDPGLSIDDSTVIGFGLDRSEHAVGIVADASRLFLRHEDDVDLAALSAAAAADAPVRTVYALQEVLDALQRTLPEAARERLRFEAVDVGDTVALPDGMATALPADRGAQPAIGWLIEGPWRALAICGDDGAFAAFWHWAANAPSLTDVICPQIGADALALLPPNVHIWLPPDAPLPAVGAHFSHPIAASRAGMPLEL
jgi:hypothetical protein